MDLTSTVKLDVIEILHDTAKAWNIKLNDGIYWLPKSQCRIVNKQVYIPEWLAKSKEISYLDIDVE